MEVRIIFTTASGKRRTLTRMLPLVIGRSSASGLKLPEHCEHVSRRHCELVCDDEGRVCVRDLQSTNGTFIAGQELPPDAAVPVKSGVGIRLGDISFRLEYPVVPAAAGTEAAQDHGAELEFGASGGARPQPTEPLREDPPAAAELPGAEDLPDAVPAAADEGDFGFLAAAEPAAAVGDWPVADGESPAADDEKLDDFFKGLS